MVTAFIRELLWWCVGIIVLGLVIAVWQNPAIITSKYNEVKSVLAQSKESSLTQEEQSCQEQVNEQLRIAEEIAPISINAYAKEIRSFNKTSQALDYLETYGIVDRDNEYDFTRPFALPEFYKESYGVKGNAAEIERTNITIVLVRSETNAYGTNVKVLVPAICIKGQLLAESKKRLKT